MNNTKIEQKKNNPIIWADFPDPDIIRVDDTYYMISTTMHLFPGGIILRSYDLVNWEVATYLYDVLDNAQGRGLRTGAGFTALVCGRRLSAIIKESFMLSL